jgi:hypothetical protein
MWFLVLPILEEVNNKILNCDYYFRVAVSLPNVQIVYDSPNAAGVTWNQYPFQALVYALLAL